MKGSERKGSERRKALQLLPYALTIVGSPIGEHEVTAILANWVMQVSFDPPLLAVAVENSSRMNEAITKSSAFSVNILPQGGGDTARAFLKTSVSSGNSLHGQTYDTARNGAPFLHSACAALACSVQQSRQAGDHTVFIGEVVDATYRREGPALLLRDTDWKYWREPK